MYFSVNQPAGFNYDTSIIGRTAHMPKTPVAQDALLELGDYGSRKLSEIIDTALLERVYKMGLQMEIGLAPGDNDHSVDEMSSMNLCYKFSPVLASALGASEDFAKEMVDTGNGMGTDHNHHCFLLAKSKTNQKRYLIDPSYKQFLDEPEGKDPCLILELSDISSLERDLAQVGVKGLDTAMLQRYLFPEAKDYPEKDVLRKFILFGRKHQVGQEFLNMIDESFAHLVNVLQKLTPDKPESDVRKLALFFYFEKAVGKINPKPSRLFGVGRIEATPLTNADAVERVQEALWDFDISSKADLENTLREFSLNDGERKFAIEAIESTLEKFNSLDNFNAMHVSTPLSLIF